MFVGKIKELLSAELDIPVSKMELRGWIHKNDALIQDTVSVQNANVLRVFLIFSGWIYIHYSWLFEPSWISSIGKI